MLYDLATRLKNEVQNRDMLQRRCHILATVLQTMQIAEPGKDVLVYEDENVVVFLYSCFIFLPLLVDYRKTQIKWRMIN